MNEKYNAYVRSVADYFIEEVNYLGLKAEA